VEEQMKARIEELKNAEREAERQLYAIRAVLGELQALLQPAPIMTEGEDA
jgi:hypothetical protein